ncbi:MAG TPA: beta-ketoacyl synthase chain length factor [Parafilimonas sp.]|nr:beta-ketoacyl synthase chain length factor [Parafilimonas sp.]
MEDVNIYIQAVAGISPQQTFDNTSFPGTVIQYKGNRLNCVEPEYDDLIDAKLIRRMSRIIKMGAAAAVKCLQRSSVEMPDGIIVGTAYGCLQDTEIFLQRMIDYNEELLTPTAFIQSTHNTVGAQIALLLQCHNYNNTFVHRGFSFESALLDAIMLLKEKEVNNVLIGSADEITNSSHDILSRFGLYKNDISSNNLYTSNTKGTIAGEGAFFFLLTSQPSEKNLAKLSGIDFLYQPESKKAIEKNIISFLAARSLTINDIDVIITGRNGDKRNDELYNELEDAVFENKQIINYKHLCGEYPTASSFALWMAAVIIKEGKIPAALSGRQQLSHNPVKTVLIYNHCLMEHHSLFLVTAC